MYDIIKAKEKAVLVFIDDIQQAKTQSTYPEEMRTVEEDELVRLAEGLEIESVARIRFRLRTIHPKHMLGYGQLEQIKRTQEETEADLIIINTALTPRIQHNIEDILDAPVLDREAVIIQLFAARAQTKEARLQTELAHLQYLLPRLAGMRSDFARQRGGVKGSKGAGESKLELDRRTVRKKITQLKKQLAVVRAHRRVQRKSRMQAGIKSVALVGYTNSGKSSLLKRLSSKDVYIADKLFATLDAKTARIYLAPDTHILLSDTVGFVSNLPHRLIDAFYSTLEEAVLADLLIIVCDASNPNFIEDLRVSESVLHEIDCANKARIIALNKCDALSKPDELQGFLHNTPNAIPISVKNGEGIDSLREMITNYL